MKVLIATQQIWWNLRNKMWKCIILLADEKLYSFSTDNFVPVLLKDLLFLLSNIPSLKLCKVHPGSYAKPFTIIISNLYTNAFT